MRKVFAFGVSRIVRLLFLTILTEMFPHSCWAQDLALRAYLITPLHSNAINLTYSFFHGGRISTGWFPLQVPGVLTA